MSTDHYNTVVVKGEPEAMPSVARLVGIWNATAARIDDVITFALDEQMRRVASAPGWDTDVDIEPGEVSMCVWDSHGYAGAAAFALAVTRDFDVTVEIGYECPDEGDKSDDVYRRGEHVLHSAGGEAPSTLLTPRQILQIALATERIPIHTDERNAWADEIARKIDAGQITPSNYENQKEWN